jgi:uncharacterized small protein (DUF1192 family)
MTVEELEETIALSEADIAELEAQIAEKDAQLAARDRENAELKARLLKLDPPPPIARLDGPFVSPNHEQFVRLFDNVIAKYPVLRGGRRELDELFSDFRKCFRFISTLERLPGNQVDATRYPTFWCDQARDWLHADISGVQPFTIAVIASCDIAHTALDRFPHSVSFGLAIGTGPAGSRKATNSWLQVLQGRFRVPVPLEAYKDFSIGTARRISAWGDH